MLLGFGKFFGPSNEFFDEVDCSGLMLDYLDHLFLHRDTAFVITSLNSQIESRMFAQQGQGMAPTFLRWEMSFEVHLPKIIRCIVFKSQPCYLFLLSLLNRSC